jgi:hypothetical protein
MARPQTEKTRNILKLHAEGKTVNEIATELNLTYTGVYSALARNDIKVRKTKTKTKAALPDAPKKAKKTKKKSRKTKKVKKTTKPKTKVKRKSKSVRKSAKKSAGPTVTWNEGTSNFEIPNQEAPNPLVSVYTPLTGPGLLNKLKDQLTYLESRAVEVKKLIAAVKNA